MVMAVDQGNAIMRRDPQIRRAPSGASLYDVLDLILDKGLVIDAFVRVSLVGIELITVDLRVVVASVDTYLRYAEGAERLQLYNRSEAKRLSDIAKETSKGHAVSKGIEKAGEVVEDTEQNLTKRLAGKDRGEEGQQEEGVAGTIGRGIRNVVGKLVHTVAGGDEGEDEGQQERGREPRQRRPEPQRQPERHRGDGSGQRAKAGARG